MIGPVFCRVRSVSLSLVKMPSADFEDLLKIYYQRLFPYDPYVKWLGAGQTDPRYLARREFSFTLADDIYLRYLSFSGAAELKAEMVKRVPHKIDVGAVYNLSPEQHSRQNANFQVGRGQVFFF